MENDLKINIKEMGYVDLLNSSDPELGFVTSYFEHGRLIG
jgi:hypothetical protein